MLKEVDEIKITVLVDNIIDMLLTNSKLVKRTPLTRNQKFNKLPIAEHGFAVLLEISYVHKNQKMTNKFLFDTGVSENGIILNSDILGLKLEDIETIVLSHGHFDHISGLTNVLKRINKSTMIVVHPDALLKRWLVFPNNNRAKFDTLNEQAIKNNNGILFKNVGITYLPYEENICKHNQQTDKDNHDPCEDNQRILITGEIPRVTSYEKGFSLQYKEGTNEMDLIPDHLVLDDQALVMNLKNKGLVVLSGCGHAGIINTVKYAIKVTGISRVFAIMGGFHLSGEGCDEVIDSTLCDLKIIDPDYIIPCHCSGWKASNKIIKEMPQKYIQTSVGSTFVFNSSD